MREIIEKKLGIPADYQYQAIRGRNFLKANWHRNKIYALSSVLPLNPQTRLLDIGTGSGNLELAFAPKVATILGLDYNEEALAFLRTQLESRGIGNVTLRNFDICSQNYFLPEEKFDVVVIMDVIEHVSLEDATRLLMWIKGILNPGGVVCVVTPNYKSAWVWLEKIYDLLHLGPTMSHGQHVCEYDMGRLCSLFEGLGYRTDLRTSFNTFSFMSPVAWLREYLCRKEIALKSRFGNLLLCLFRI